MSGEFGSIITDDMVEDVVVACIKRWFSTFFGEVEEAVGLERGFYQRPPEGSYFVRNDMEKWPEEMLPAIVVVSTGLVDRPVKDGKGTFRAKWSIGVGVVASSIAQDESRRYAYRMGAACRELLNNKQSLDKALDGNVRGIEWLDGRNNELLEPEAGQRTIWAQRQLFAVEVAKVGSMFAGPTAPDPLPEAPDPYPAPPTVPDAAHVMTTVEKEPIDG